MLQTINGIDLVLVLIIWGLGLIISAQRRRLKSQLREIIGWEQYFEAYKPQECCQYPDILEKSPYHDQCLNCGNVREYY